MDLEAVFSAKAVKKIVFVETVNVLLDQMHSRRLILPDYVYRKEGAVFSKGERGENLMVATRKLLWDDTIARQQRKRKQTLLTRDKESLEFFQERLAQLLEAGMYEDARNVEDDISALEVEIQDLEYVLTQQNPRAR